MDIPTQCPECNSSEALVWRSRACNMSNAPDGRLCAHDVEAVFYIACLKCSSTVKTYSSDDVIKILTKATLGGLKQLAEPI
jgi:hypothetical protein